jgi:hypothetical protein
MKAAFPPGQGRAGTCSTGSQQVIDGEASTSSIAAGTTRWPHKELPAEVRHRCARRGGLVELEFICISCMHMVWHDEGTGGVNVCSPAVPTGAYLSRTCFCVCVYIEHRRAWCSTFSTCPQSPAPPAPPCFLRPPHQPRPPPPLAHPSLPPHLLLAAQRA